MTSSNSKNNHSLSKVKVTYDALVNWIEKAEKCKGSSESKLFIRNAENYAKSITQALEPIDISNELKRIEILKKSLQ